MASSSSLVTWLSCVYRGPRQPLYVVCGFSELRADKRSPGKCKSREPDPLPLEAGRSGKGSCSPDYGLWSWSQSSRRRVFSASREHHKRVGSCWCSVSARNASSSADGECTDTGEAPGGGEVPSKGETRKASGKKVVKTKAKAASSSTAAAGQEQEVSSKRSR